MAKRVTITTSAIGTMDEKVSERVQITYDS